MCQFAWIGSIAWNVWLLQIGIMLVRVRSHWAAHQRQQARSRSDGTIFFCWHPTTGTRTQLTYCIVRPDQSQAQLMGVNWKRATARTKKQGNSFIGMPVYISADRFFFNESICKKPTYKRSKQDKAAHFHGDWRTDPARLPLPKMLTIIETECGTIYPVNKYRILIEDKRGTFFSAAPLSEDSAG
jgi:hypothetical protein